MGPGPPKLTAGPPVQIHENVFIVQFFFKSGTLQCGVCMFSRWLDGFSPGAPVRQVHIRLVKLAIRVSVCGLVLVSVIDCNPALVSASFTRRVV